MQNFMRIYNRLPPFMRDAAATLRGYYLGWWRYGPHTEDLVAEILERDKWAASQWKTYQENRLEYILYRAATHVPYYREYWADRRRSGDLSSWQDLNNWPVLSKEVVRRNPLAFVADDCNPKRMFHVSTSGTTGKPLDIWRQRITETTLYALIEARGRRWHGVSRHQPWAILGGQQIIPAERPNPPFWVWNRAGNQLYLSASHISPNRAMAFANAIMSYHITHLVAYASSAAFLCQQFLDNDFCPSDQIRLVLTNSEPLYSWQRVVISKALKCPVRQMYGLGETVAQASEDINGQLRVWPEVGLIEIMDDEVDELAPSGQSGRLIGTGLLNSDMLFIRYDTGDRANLLSKGLDSTDPVQLPIISDIEGRRSDLLLARDGRRVYWLNPVFYGLPLVEAQIIQEAEDHIRVVFVPGIGYTAKTRVTIMTRLQQIMGKLEVSFEQVDQIPRGPNGKFRPVINRVNLADKFR